MGKMFMDGMQSAAGDEAKMLTDNYDLLVTVLKMFVDSDLGTAQGLKRFELGRLIKGYGPEMMKLVKGMAALDLPGAQGQMENLRQSITGMEGVTTTVDSKSGDEAMITVNMPGQPVEKASMKRVEGRWVPAELVDQMPMMMALAKSELAGMDMKEINESLEQAQAMLPMMDQAMEPLQKAKTQEEFDQALMQMVAMVGMAMNASGSE